MFHILWSLEVMSHVIRFLNQLDGLEFLFFIFFFSGFRGLKISEIVIYPFIFWGLQSWESAVKTSSSWTAEVLLLERVAHQTFRMAHKRQPSNRDVGERPGAMTLCVSPQTFHRAERKTLVVEGSFLSLRMHHLEFRELSWMLLMLIIFNITVIYSVCIVILH